MALRRRAATAMRMGSVGALLPLLTVAGASAVSNRREALNAPLKSQKSASECLTTTASLAFQGLKSGLAWTIAVDAYAMTSVTDAELARYMATRPGCSVVGEIARKLGPLCMRNVLGFAGFLGLFGGVSCSLEVLRSKNDLLNPFVGGFTAGLVFLQQEFRKPRTHLTSAIVCGVFAMAIHHLIPAISKESESEDVAAVETRSLDYEDFFGVVYGPREQNQAALSSSNRQTANYTGPEEDTDSTADSDCVVSLLRSKYESRKVHQVFRDWDIDKNGGVTLAEIESNLRRQGLRISKPELMKLFDTYDLDRDGRLLYDEFKRLVYGPVHEPRYSYLAEQRRQNAHKQPMHERDSLEFFRKSTVPEQSNHSIDNPRFRATLKLKLKEFAARLNDAYAEFDDDHNGYLSYSELCVGLKELGLNLTEREFLHLATRVDADGNGEICFKEFCHVFGSDGAVNRRCQSARTGDEEDKRVEEKSAKTQLKHGSQRQRAAGTFNFSHLTRRAKTPTRCGRTPYPDTRGIISDNQGDTTNPARFMTESQLYGSASTSRSIPIPAKVITTLGQEEKQRLDAAKANRLQRLRVQMELYEDQARPLQDSYNVAQERRVRTLQRHRERYHQRIEQRPRYAQSPARKGIQILRASSTAPIV
ncbi:Calcium-dependent protein kinase [Phytophthora nicotianae]|uniref:Calcium-dependent protein kinase n=1 Tax=Phytophthora nicotianae TaxID=4792 RepID=A0A0W8CB62_PHYNI|nr:Calcium-dependent protein kinase [Phytophthora nicotianae]